MPLSTAPDYGNTGEATRGGFGSEVPGPLGGPLFLIGSHFELAEAMAGDRGDLLAADAELWKGEQLIYQLEYSSDQDTAWGWYRKASAFVDSKRIAAPELQRQAALEDSQVYMTNQQLNENEAYQAAALREVADIEAGYAASPGAGADAAYSEIPAVFSPVVGAAKDARAVLDKGVQAGKDALDAASGFVGQLGGYAVYAGLGLAAVALVYVLVKGR